MKGFWIKGRVRKAVPAYKKSEAANAPIHKDREIRFFKLNSHKERDE
jgi:hypothetical protein